MVRCFQCMERIQDRTELVLAEVEFHAGAVEMPHHEDCVPEGVEVIQP